MGSAAATTAFTQIPTHLRLLGRPCLYLQYQNVIIMLSEEEKAFMVYWEKNRARQKKTFYQLLVGLPLGLLLALPILLNYLSGWNKRAVMVGNAQSSPFVLLIAVLAIAVFFSIFNKRHKWEMNEQRYLELKGKAGKDVKTG